MSLRYWQPRVAQQLRQIFFVFIMPLILLDSVMLSQSQINWFPGWHLALLIAVSGAMFIPRLDPNLRNSIILGGLISSCLLGLATFGLFGSYLVGLCACAIFTMILLPRPYAIRLISMTVLAFLGILISVGLTLISLPAEHSAYFNQPTVLVTHGLLTISIGSSLILALGSLLSALQQSLEQTKHALTSQLQLSAALDATVAQRTNELQQTTQTLAAELRMSETLARCSQLLLVAKIEEQSWEPTVQQVLAMLRTEAACAQLSLCVEALGSDGVTRRISVADAAPDRSLIKLTDVQLADLDPSIMAQLCQGMQVELAPQLLKLTEPTTASSAPLLLYGLIFQGQLRGLLLASEPAYAVWSSRSVRLLRNGIEQLTAFLQRWETAAHLRLTEAQLRAVGDNFPNGFIYQLRRDEQWRPYFTYLSSGVERVLGVKVEDGLRDPDCIHRLVIAEDYQHNDLLSRERAAVKEDLKVITRHRLADGSLRWLYLCSRPRPHPLGGTVWDGVALDVTEQHLATEELARARDAAEAANRAKSAFLAAMSHEIRTPLHAVIGMSDLLLTTELTATQQTYARTIQRGGNALLAVINDILDFSRIESGKLELETAPFDLYDWLQGTIDLVRYSAEQKHIHLTWQCAPEVPRVVLGDSARLQQVLLNLLGNAIKFTDQGQVRLEVSAPSQTLAPEAPVQITFCVHDTGIGISAPQLERLFAPFIQADNSINRRYGGTGLGLSISQQLVQLMGGTITVQSTPGIGSTFMVSVPMRVLPDAPLAPPPDPPALSRPSLRLLVAEDNPINQEVIRLMLQRLGYMPDIVNDGAAALKAVQQADYDLVLMDIQMPVLSGEQATRQIRATVPPAQQPRIVALSASPDPEDRERMLAAGMDAYLAKPLQLHALQALLETIERGLRATTESTTERVHASDEDRV